MPTTDRSPSPLRRTPLYDRHKALGAKLIDFGGWEMPVQYSGILDEHKTVREAVGIFDVSHMGEIFFEGPSAAEAVQRVVTNDVSRLKDTEAFYTCTLREDGGIVDDLIVGRINAETFLIVVNASNVAKDYQHFVRHAAEVAPDCKVIDRSDRTALLAVQGPRAIDLCKEVFGEVPPRSFTMISAALGSVPVGLSRTGYTGEDGVEVSCDVAEVGAIWDRLLEKGKAYGIKPIGLGARDTLRLEAKLCLYGNDIDEQHDPIEAGLGWVVKGKGFVGEEAVERVRAEGPSRKLVGFKVIGRGIARHGYSIHRLAAGDSLGERVGEVTSGTVAPTVGGAVGMGYVPTELAAVGTRLGVDCRGKPAVVEIVDGPFYRRAK